MEDIKHGSEPRQTGVEHIARWAFQIPIDHVPQIAIDQAMLLLLDSIGCAVAARSERVTEQVASFCEDMGTSGPCTVIGRPFRATLPNAVLANGTAVRVLDLNDYVIATGNSGPKIGGHPSDNIAVALAVGEARQRSGRDVLASIAIGYELYGRLKGMMDRKGPWDGVSLSAFVTAVMAGRLMDLTHDQLRHALALSGARAATPGIVRHGGISAAKSIANAFVAQSAMEATLLAEKGMTGPTAIFEHRQGLRSLFPEGDLSQVMAPPFPEESYIMRSNVKAYPCLATGQAAVAAALDLRRNLKEPVESLERIDVVMADYSFVREQQHDPGRVRPDSREAADHSFQFLVAVSLLDGEFGTAQFANERWHDPKVLALLDRMLMHTDADLNRRAPGSYPCILRVGAGGHDYQAEILYPPGFSKGGLNRDEVVSKFNSVASSLSRSRRDALIEATLNLHAAGSLDTLCGLLHG